jgi:hypothetical protein
MVAVLLSVACAQVYNETEVKAAFLYHFTSYVEYPASAFASPTSPFVVGILGKSAVFNALQEAVRGKTVKGRQVEVRQVSLGEQLRECHLLFIPEGETGNLPKVLAILGATPVLLVGESERFAAKGGVIGFFMEQNRVRFEVNLDSAKRAQLNISAKLLSLARIVKADRRS